MSKSRTQYSRRNVMFSVVGRMVGMVTSFVGRGIFVKVLSSEYLGLGGFFGNIFAVISLCEIGLGAAITQSLYKPLARDDKNEISAIMGYFIKVNKIFALLTATLSLLAVPLLFKMTKSSIDAKEILCAYLLFALHTSLSYLLSAKKCLVVCDQKMYAVTAVNSVASVVTLLLSSVVLLKTNSYIMYLAARIVTLTVRDIVINYYADVKYPYLSKKHRPTKEYLDGLYKNVRALVWHKAGYTLNRCTDSLLISFFAGLSGMGKFSNYALVMGTVGAFFDVAVSAVTASVGNLGAVDRGVKSETVMRKLYFINFFLLTLGLCVMVSTINPFISLWLGKDMVFTSLQMAAVMASFYLSCIRDPVQIFVSTYGLFRQTRFIPVTRAVINLVLSCVFVKTMGIAGVFLGTAVSTFVSPLFYEVKALYRYGFGGMERSDFVKEMLMYIASSTLIAIICASVTSFLPQTVPGVLMKAAVSFGVSFLALVLLYRDSQYFEFIKKTFDLRKILGR